jgi:hypothetical protein
MVTPDKRQSAAGAARGPDIFGDAAPSATDVLKGTIAATDRRTGSLVEAAKKSEALEKAVAAHETDEPLLNQLLGNIEQGRNCFVVEDADGNVSLGFADAENHDIDMQAALSHEVRAVDVPAEAAA